MEWVFNENFSQIKFFLKIHFAFNPPNEYNSRDVSKRKHHPDRLLNY